MDDHHMTASLHALKYVKNVTYSTFKLKGAEVLGDNFKHSRRHGGFRRGTCILDRTTENWGQLEKKQSEPVHTIMQHREETNYKIKSSCERN